MRTRARLGFFDCSAALAGGFGGLGRLARPTGMETLSGGKSLPYSTQLATLRARREALELDAARRSYDAETAEATDELDAVEPADARRARLAALRDAAKRKRGDAPPTTKRIRVTRDARGDEQLELDGDPSVGASRVVMMRWEKPYMEACADALDVGADDAVLEVGYGLGFSAARVAAARPRRHVVAECDETVAARAAAAGFEVAATTWQAFLARAPTDSYTRVFFDDFPIVAAAAGDASRWRTFLRAVTPHLAAGARVTGYAADEALLRASLPGGFALESAAAFACEPPPDCPYLAPGAGDALVVPVVVFNTI